MGLNPAGQVISDLFCLFALVVWHSVRYGMVVSGGDSGRVVSGGDSGSVVSGG